MKTNAQQISNRNKKHVSRLAIGDSSGRHDRTRLTACNTPIRLHYMKIADPTRVGIPREQRDRGTSLHNPSARADITRAIFSISRSRPHLTARDTAVRLHYMKIIVADKISERGLALLAETKWEISTPTAAALAKEIANADGLIVRSATHVTADLLELATKL